MSVVKLVPVDASIASSYDNAGKTGQPRSQCRPLVKLGKAGVAVQEAADALKALSDEVAKAGGDLRITECHRDISVQRRARDKYDNWLKAGKPSRSSPAFNSSTMKADYVALPGRSGHNAGRSIDVHISELKFPGIPKDKQLDKLWDIAIPLGWEPIIKSANEGASEAWHFDFPGELRGVKKRLGYEQWALCGALLVGHGDLQGYGAVTQALLCRAGFDIGGIDGKPGPKTAAALGRALGISDSDAKSKIDAKDESIWPALLALPAK